jgi:hypothetical protein
MLLASNSRIDRGEALIEQMAAMRHVTTQSRESGFFWSQCVIGRSRKVGLSATWRELGVAASRVQIAGFSASWLLGQNRPKLRG